MRNGRGESIAAPLGWAAAATALAVALTSVPLFDLIGYELALAVAPLVAMAALHLGLRETARARARWSFSDREAVDLRPNRSLFALALRALLRTLPALAIPLAVMALNALRVRNCNATIGFQWYFVLPVGSAIFGAALGVAIGVAAPRCTRRYSALLTALAVLLVAAAWSIARLYYAPPIFVFDPIFGYFAGSLYDEHVAVPDALLYARLYHFAIAAAALAVVAWKLDGHRLAMAWRNSRRGIWALVTMAFAIYLYARGPHFGYRHDAGSIARAMGGERKSEHFVLHYRPDGPYARELDDVARELEFRYAELRAAIGIEPNRAVHAYLFGSAAEKQTLMGAGRTYIAKPWRAEIYVNHEPFPQAVLAHELAHVFGAGVGDRVLGIARDGLRIDVGLTEGFAEALTWHGTTLTPDESVHALDLMGRLPSLDAVMSFDFWSLPAQQAYAIAGSFVHFLLERSGPDRLLALYRRGGATAAYPDLYGASFAELKSAWLAKIRAGEMSNDTLERERDRILRPSIFRRPCAHELARRIELAHTLSGRGDFDGARKLYEDVCADEPDDPGHLDELLTATARAGHEKAATAIAERLLAHAKSSATQRGAALSTLGDLLEGVADYRGAASYYARAELAPIEEPIARLYTVKRLLAERLADDHDPLHATLARVLTALTRPSADPLEDFLHITEAARLAPTDALLAYLAARQLYARGQYAEAATALEAVNAAALPDERFAREALRLDAECAFRKHDYAEAAKKYSALTGSGSAAARLDAALWARRARYFEAH